MRPAEVWNVDSAGLKTKLGSDVTCADAGSMVALAETSSGTIRLAAACEFDGSGDSGLVKVFDLELSATTSTWEWVEVGGSPLSVDPTGSTDGLLGFDLSWALDGTRLGMSAPNYGNGTSIELGLVRVYDFDGTSTWTQVGADIVGVQENEKSGFTMDLSGNGQTLVVGSPNKDTSGNTNTGAVRIYTLQSGTTWQFEQEIVGDAAGDVLGRGISVNSDGTRFCASSYAHNSDRGQVQVFDLSGGLWTSIAEFEGDASGDLLGFNNMGVSMTTTGQRLVMAAIGAQTNGIVQVFDSFTLAPSLAPSASPAPTVAKNLNMTKFDWDIFALPDLTEIELSEDAETSEIILHYNISIRDTKIQAFESDCVTPIPDNVTSLTSESITTSTTHTNFSIAVDIHQDTIMDYPSVWTDVDVGQGLISICVRLDLVLDDPAETSVNFYEQKLFVNVGLLSGFTITGIDLTRLEATEETGTADVEYNVTACHCNAARTCIDTVLTQGSDVYLCVETTAANIEISEIRDLTMAQGAFNTTPIVDGVPDALTFVTINGKEASIRYQIISAFFADAFPADIVATGQALLSFTDDNGRRLLRTSRINIVQPDRERELLGEVQEDDFKVTMAVQGSELESSGAFACGFASVIVIMVSGVVAVL